MLNLFEREGITASMALGLATFLIVFLLLWGFRQVFGVRLRRLTLLKRSPFAEFLLTQLANTRIKLLLIIAIFIGAQWLPVSERAGVALRVLTLFAVLLQLGEWLSNLVMYLMRGASHRRAVARGLLEGEDQQPASLSDTFNTLGMVLKGVVWFVVLLLALDNIPGVQITALFASLGVAGLAVGLAVQNILGDLFASLSIILDKPFEVGDTIRVDEMTGEVQHIGLKSTRLRSITGEQLVFGNSDLLSSRVRNFKRMQRRTSIFTLRVPFETPHDKLANIPTILKDIVNAQEQVTFDRAHLKTIGEYAFEFEVAYFIETPDFTAFLDIQQAINLEIHRRFEEHGILLALPAHKSQVVDARGPVGGQQVEMG